MSSVVDLPNPLGKMANDHSDVSQPDATHHRGVYDKHLAAHARRNTKLLGLAALILIVLATTPLWAGGSFGLSRYSVALAYVVAAIGLNIAFGYAGEMVLGHPAIMAASAYGAGISSAMFGLAFPAAAAVGVLAGVLFGLVMMMPGLRVSGWYLALITMFMVIVVPHLVILTEPWTGGEFGLSGVKVPALFGQALTDANMFHLSLLVFALVWIGATNLIRSDWGLRFRALRDARQAAQAVGFNLSHTRAVTYLVCAVPPAIAGVMLAFSQRFVNAESFGISLTLLLLTGVVLGGAGTLWGPIVGMVPLIALSFWVDPFSPYNAVFLGLGLLVGTLLFPDGLIPALLGRRKSTVKLEEKLDPQAAPVAARHGRSESSKTRQDRSSPDILIAKDIRKRFGGQHALDGVNLSLTAGTFVGLVGPNGSGKSTFLNALSGMIRVDSGSISILGNDVTASPVHRIAAAGVGRTFQVPQLIDDLSALENIELGLTAQNPSGLLAAVMRLPSVARAGKARKQAALDIFGELGLPAESLLLPASKLPLGLKRIVEVGRAIASSPALLLLDEPAAGLNDDERIQLGLLLQKLNTKGMTVLVVEHNVPFVMRFCDELVLLEAGKVVCRADLHEAELPAQLESYLNFSPSADAGAALDKAAV
jgi:ABC-type branched-subunit amino acid transport system ATPase component/ABC-type branched-subunit amino acid transport system permease subunit